MVPIILLLSALLTAEPIKFIQPKQAIMLGKVGGTEVSIQVLLDLQPEDRWLDVDVMTGELRVGGFSKELEGTNSDSIQPFYKAHVERLGPGSYYILARICRSKEVIDNRTACSNPRATLAKELTICGGDVSCQDD
jgi:hypothetical protein